MKHQHQGQVLAIAFIVFKYVILTATCFPGNCSGFTFIQPIKSGRHSNTIQLSRGFKSVAIDTVLRASTGSNEDSDGDDGWGEGESEEKEEAFKVPEQKVVEEERDMFIPIFALVSITGFFGLYAYETLRLALNGELYLPGAN